MPLPDCGGAGSWLVGRRRYAGQRRAAAAVLGRVERERVRIALPAAGHDSGRLPRPSPGRGDEPPDPLAEAVRDDERVRGLQRTLARLPERERHVRDRPELVLDRLLVLRRLEGLDRAGSAEALDPGGARERLAATGASRAAGSTALVTAISSSAAGPKTSAKRPGRAACISRSAEPKCREICGQSTSPKRRPSVGASAVETAE